MNNSLVSVIVTSYKRPAELVTRAVKSILNQTYKNIEIIVVDDSPNDYEYRDKVKEEVIKLDSSIKYISHDKNMGACAARNTGIKASNGEFVAFLDDDDEWLPQKLEKQVPLFENKNVALVYARAYINSSNGKNLFKATPHRGKVYGSLMMDNFVGSTSFVICRRTALEDVGYFDEKMQSSQDYELWLRIAKKYEVDYVEEPLVNYYFHAGEQITKNPEKKVSGLTRVNELNMDYLKKHRKTYSKNVLQIVPYCWKIDKWKAIKLLTKGICLYPFNFYEIARAGWGITRHLLHK